MSNYLSNLLCGISGKGLYAMIKAGIKHKGDTPIPDELRGSKNRDYSVRLTQAEYAALDALRLPNESNLQLTLRTIFTGSKYL